jgi:hypothetical protein
MVKTGAPQFFISGPQGTIDGVGRAGKGGGTQDRKTF